MVGRRENKSKRGQEINSTLHELIETAQPPDGEQPLNPDQTLFLLREIPPQVTELGELKGIPGNRNRLVKIDGEMLYRCAAMQMTRNEVAVMLDIPSTTLAPYDYIFDMGREYGKATLRQTLWRNAVVLGKESSAIFLAKNHLDMAEKPDQATSITNMQINMLPSEEVMKRLDQIQELKNRLVPPPQPTQANDAERKDE